MSKAELKTRKCVGIDKRNGKWGVVIITFEAGTESVISNDFIEATKQFHSGAMIEAEGFIEEALVGNGLED